MTFGVRMQTGRTARKWTKQRWRCPRGPGTLFRKALSIKYLFGRDRAEVTRFLLTPYPFHFPTQKRVRFLKQLIQTTNAVRGYHTLCEILRVCDSIFSLGDKEDIVVVEAGAGSGASTAKLSLATQIVGGRLVVFDSFRGIPANDEEHRLLDGTPLRFRRGAFRGRMAAVKKRVSKYGAIEVCDFKKGLFEETLLSFHETIDVALLDVDLEASTRTCTRRLYPLLKAHGSLFSQDGHLQRTVDLFSNPSFWHHEVEVEAPHIDGLGSQKLLKINAGKLRDPNC